MLRRLGKLARGHHSQVVVMIAVMVRPIVVMPGGLDLNTRRDHRAMLRHHMPDGKEPSKQETKCDDAACVRHERKAFAEVFDPVKSMLQIH